MLTDPQRLIDALADAALIDDAQLITLLGKDYEHPDLPTLENALVAHNILSRERLRTVKQAAYGYDVFDPDVHTPVQVGSYPHGVIDFPREWAASAGVIQIAAERPTFAAVENIVVRDTTSHEDWLRQQTNGDVDLLLITAPDFREAFQQVYDNAEAKTLDAPPTIHQILTQSVNEGASDIHLTVGQAPTLRVNGSLRRNDCAPVDADWMRQATLALGGEKALATVDEIYQCDFAYPFGGVRFRVTVGKDRHGINIVARRLPPGVPKMSDLALPPVIQGFKDLERGLVLITGPTGSGKSTTLAALLGEISRYQSRHIITLEDPIEYVLPTDGKATVNQRELGETLTSFANGLRQALRQDPDVILVGELRDTETIRTALLAAETGHLVFATTHTTTAEGSIQRLLAGYDPAEQEAVRQQVAGSLRGIVGQMLIPRVSGKGRVACFEILVNTPGVSTNLRRADGMPTVRQLMETSQADGMQTMDQGLASMVRKGVISEEEGVFRARDRDAFYRFLSVK